MWLLVPGDTGEAGQLGAVLLGAAPAPAAGTQLRAGAVPGRGAGHRLAPRQADAHREAGQERAAEPGQRLTQARVYHHSLQAGLSGQAVGVVGAAWQGRVIQALIQHTSEPGV